MADGLVSLKLTAEQAKAETEYTPATLPEYNYGTSVCLCNEDLDKLGITEMPVIGAVVTFTARAEVCNLSVYANQASTDRCVTLQITDMAIKSGMGEKSAAEKLFSA